MSVSKVLYSTAYEILISILPKGINESDLDKYFVGDSSNPKDLRDVYISFIRAAQDYQFLPNVIQFDARKNRIGTILNDFDYKYASTLNAEKLYETFKSEIGVSGGKSWRLWTDAVIDSAKFIRKFQSLEEFDSYVTGANDLKTVPLDISKQINGMGFAIACLSLKELGYLDYIKPDVHLKDICVSLGLSSEKPKDIFDALIKVARENNVTPYKLDKVLWLVCSGYFYKHNIRVGSHKEELILKAKSRIGGIQPNIRIRKHTKEDSRSDVQLDIEKVLIKKLEKHLNLSGLDNNSYVSFKGSPSSKIKPDIFSEQDHIIGEVYSHVGKLKPSQIDKIEADILKMILFEKDSGIQYQKYYVVCDDEVVKSMRGNSVIMASVRLFGIKICNIALNENMRNKLIETMKKQDITG